MSEITDPVPIHIFYNDEMLLVPSRIRGSVIGIAYENLTGTIHLLCDSRDTLCGEQNTGGDTFSHWFDSRSYAAADCIRCARKLVSVCDNLGILQCSYIIAIK